MVKLKICALVESSIMLNKVITFRFVRNVVLVLLGFLITFPSFFVYADEDGSYYYVPNESISAYNFFRAYNMALDESRVYLGYSQNAIDIDGSITPNYTFLQSAFTYFSDGKIFHENTYFKEYGAVSVDPKYAIDLSLNSSESSYLSSYINYHGLTGDFTNPSSYDSNKRIYIAGGREYVISFISSSSLPATDGITGFSNVSNADVSINRYLVSLMYGNKNLTKYTYIIKNNGSSAVSYSLSFNFNNTSNLFLIPLFVGRKEELTDEYAQMVGLNTDIESALQSIDSKLTTFLNGNSNTQNKVNEVNNTNSAISSSSNDFHNLESSSMDDFSNNLSSIDLDNSLIQSNGFFGASRFVRVVFSNLLSRDGSGAMHNVLIYSLIIGLALTIIGKLRS